MKKSHKITFSFIFILFLLFSISNLLEAQENIFNKVDENNNLRMGNEYIVIVVNQNENSKARFAIETTGGAPFKDSDDYKPLVYGRPNPWTSYTTIRIDEKNYVFGGKTERRAGKNANYGKKISDPQVKDGKVITSYKMDGIVVEQILSIVKSSTTGLFDSAQIKYRITNTNDIEKEVALRVMLDTMLGKNDGAPLRMGNKAITTDKLFSRNELANFWQAFDSISSPKVTSQGTFKGQGVTSPDKVYFADWGSLADGSWDFDFNPGQEFIRKGGYEIDSAIAMYWEKEKLKSGESKTYITNYGLGGITIVPGLISLGVTSPAEFILDKPNKNFPIIAYIENTSDIEAENVSIKLDIPDEFKVENKIKELGNLKSGEIRQIIWKATPNDTDIYQEKKAIDFKIKVKADNTDSNQVERSVKLIGPPGLETSATLSDNIIVERGKIKPNPFTISAQIENNGDSTLYNVDSELVLPPGITLAKYEKTNKSIGAIKSGEKINVNWEVKSLNVEGGFKYAVVTEGLHGYSQTIKENINLPSLKPTVYFKTNQNPKRNELITIDIMAENFNKIRQMDLRISYDKDYLKPIMVYPGDIFVKDNKIVNWNEVNFANNGLIQIKNILPENHQGNILTSLQFRLKKGEELPEKLPIDWHQIFIIDNNGNEVEIEKIKGVYIDE